MALPRVTKSVDSQITIDMVATYKKYTQVHFFSESQMFGFAIYEQNYFKKTVS